MKKLCDKFVEFEYESSSASESGGKEQERDGSWKCVITNGEKEFIVNKELLCSKSVYFKTMFQSEMKESLSNQVTLNGISTTALGIILKYIETETFDDDQDEDVLVELMASSHMLMIDELHEHCCKRIEITETNYPQMITLSEIYPSESFQRTVADFQAKYFRNLRGELILLPSRNLQYLLTNSTIEASADEIVDFLLIWAKKEENFASLSSLLPLVNMSSLTEESLHQYLMQESLFSDKELCNVFKETVSLSHIYFTIYDDEIRAYSFKNKTWITDSTLPKQIQDASIYYVNDKYYAVKNCCKQIEVINLNACAVSDNVLKIIDCHRLYETLIINKCLYIIACYTPFPKCALRLTACSLYVHVYDTMVDDFNIVAVKRHFCTDIVLSVTSSETCLYILIPSCIFRLDLTSFEWESLTPPVAFFFFIPKVTHRFLGFLDHLYFFHLKEKLGFHSNNENIKSLVEFKLTSPDKGLVSCPCNHSEDISGVESHCHHVYDMKVYKLTADNTWQEVSVFKDFPCHNIKPLNPPIGTNRRLPLLYCLLRNSKSYLFYDFRCNEWTFGSFAESQSTPSPPNIRFKNSSLNYIYQNEFNK